MSAELIITNGKAWSGIELNQAKTGRVYGKLRVSSSFKENNQWKSMYFDVTIFDENLMKLPVQSGDKIDVTGIMKTSEYTDKSGNLKSGFKLTAKKINGIEAAPFEKVEQFQPKQPQEQNTNPNIYLGDDDGLPF